MRGRSLAGTAACVLAIALAAACSSNSSSGSSGTGSSTTTATFAEEPGAGPDYIFPMLTGTYYSVANIEEFQRLSYRSLYWIGDNGSPVINQAMSLADMPTYSDGNTVVTIHLRNYKWSDGQPVTTRDVAFWINLLKANKASFAAYIPGEFPDNLKSYKIVNSQEIVLTLTKAFNPNWFTYDQLSQITPIPAQTWDKTSASGQAGNYDQTPSGAVKVFNYLTAQSKDIATYGSNPLWQVVDGPWKMASYQSGGYVKFAANPAYSGPDNHKLKFFVEQPYTSETSELNVLRSGHTLSYGYVPLQESSQAKVLQGQGYTSAAWNSWGINFFVLNYNNPTTGAIVSQPYVRQAMQSLIDENAYIKGPLQGYGHTEYGPIPSKPSNPFVDSYETNGPWPYSVSAATNLLKSHGWTVHPGGVSTCTSPGSGASQCGAGVPSGAKMVFSLPYASGNVEGSQEMQALKSAYSQAGIQVNLSTAPFNTIISRVAPCKSSQSTCSWQMAWWGGGWTYGVDPYPTGDQLFATGSGSNFSNYSDSGLDALIGATVHANTSLQSYEDYMAKNAPVIWLPMPVYQLSEIASNLHGATPQSPIESLTPENWSFSS
jgi:peptide/nickel transport system substrate-binding protein